MFEKIINNFRDSKILEGHRSKNFRFKMDSIKRLLIIDFNKIDKDVINGNIIPTKRDKLSVIISSFGPLVI